MWCRRAGPEFRPRAAVCAAIAFALLLAGCSSVRLAYDNADTLLRWEAKSYLDVHGGQADELEARIAAFLAWHRKTALPEYARLAVEAAARVEKGLSQEDLVWGYDSAVAQVRETLRGASAQGADLLDRLSEDQVVHMESRVAEDNRKFARERLQGTPQERRKDRVQRVAERLEEWVGPLNDTQAGRIAQYSARAPLLDELRDREHRRRQTELFALLRAHQAKQRLADWAAQWESGRDPSYEEALRADRDELFDMLRDLDRSLSAEQRARAVAKFRRYAGDFTRLAAEGAGR